MTTYRFTGFSPSAIASSGGTQLQLDPAWQERTHGYSFEISDDDTRFGGDAYENEVGDDSSQTGVVRDPSGKVIASGRTYLEEAYVFSDEHGNTVRLYKVEIGGTHAGYIADGPIQPGNSYSLTGSENVTDNNAPTYSAIESQSYDEDGQNAVVGTANADTLIGGAGDDGIAGGAGDDLIDGGAGSDSLWGGAGQDTILFGAGDDSVWGGDGDDWIDDVDGAVIEGANLIDGGTGNDTIFAGGGRDTVSGGTGNDEIWGETGDDLLDGGGGDDLIEGGAGDDTLSGGDDAADTRTGTITTGNYAQTGGGYTVTAQNVSGGVLGAASGANVSTGGGGLGASGSVSDTDSGQSSQLGFDKASGISERLTVDFDEDVTAASFSFASLWTADFAEVGHWAIYDDGALVAEQDFTEATAYSGSGVVDLSGFGAFDRIVFTARLQADGTDGSDFVVTGISYTMPTTLSSDDTLRGGTGDDILSGGTGDDLLSGGDDADRFVIEDGFGADTVQGGEGRTTGVDADRLDFSALSRGVSVSFSGGEAGAATDGTDNLSFSEIEALTLSDHDDTVDATGQGMDLEIDAGAGDDLIRTYGQNASGLTNVDTIHGGAGNDTISSGGADDLIYGGDGDDVISSGYSNDGAGDTVYGGAGNDTIDSWEDSTNRNSGVGDYVDGGSGDDSIRGTTGGGGWQGDTILGGTGNDTIRGGGGPDDLSGGDDADTFLVEDGFAATTISGGEGGADDDHVDFSALSGGIDVTYSGDEAGSASSGADTLSFSGIERMSLTDRDDAVDARATGTGVSFDGQDGDDSLAGGTGNDTFLGGLGADTISGGAGDDYIDGGEGDDFLTTGTGQDTIFGGAGNDTIMNSSGDDSLSGGTGDDSIVASGGDDTLEGGAGNDTLEGGIDNDLLTGGDGDDVFIYQPGDGHDTITDFNSGNTGTLDDGDSTNNDYVDLSGYYDNLSELYADQADDGILNQSNTTDSKGRAVDYSDNTQFGAGSMTFQGASADSSSFTAENTSVICFAAGTAIRTPSGDRLIEELRVGDLVSTLDDGPQRIRWIGRRDLGPRDLAAHPHLRPILLRRGVLGAERDLLVSPQHGLLMPDETLLRAKFLAEARGNPVRVAQGRRQVSYIHLLFDRHQILLAENVRAESLYPGSLALGAIAPEARAELVMLFPDLVANHAMPTEGWYGASARAYVTRRAALGEGGRIAL